MGYRAVGIEGVGSGVSRVRGGRLGVCLVAGVFFFRGDREVVLRFCVLRG